MPRYGVDQRTVEIAHTGVHHQAGRLVDDHQLVVLINYVKGNVFGFYGRVVVRTVKHQRDDIARTHLVVALHRLAVHVDETRVSSLLDTVARRVLYVLRHKLVDAYRLLPPVYLHAQVFVELFYVVQLFRHVCLLFIARYRWSRDLLKLIDVSFVIRIDVG